MCKKAYRPCLNITCDGFAETLDLVLCDNRPNCEIEYKRLSKTRRSTEVYCPDCRGLTKQQRRNQTAKARSVANKAKAESSEAQEGITNDAGHVAQAEVEQQAESSTMAVSSGVVGDGLSSNFENCVSTSEETKETEELDDPALLAEEDDLRRPNLTGSLQNEERMELVSGSDETRVGTAANEEYALTNTFPDITDGCPSLLPEEESVLRPNFGSLQNDERMELVSGSEESTVDTPANEEYSFTENFLDVTHGSQGFRFGEGPLIPIDPALLHAEDIDAYPYPVGPVRNIQEAEQDLRDMGFLF